MKRGDCVDGDACGDALGKDELCGVVGEAAGVFDGDGPGTLSRVDGDCKAESGTGLCAGAGFDPVGSRTVPCWASAAYAN